MQASPDNPSIVTIRKAAGLSQTALATRAGISRATLSKIEKGQGKHTQQATIAALAQALGITPDMCSAAIAAGVTSAAELNRMGQSSNETQEESALRTSGWHFFHGLDRDLASGLRVNSLFYGLIAPLHSKETPSASVIPLMCSPLA